MISTRIWMAVMEVSITYSRDFDGHDGDGNDGYGNDGDGNGGYGNDGDGNDAYGNKNDGNGNNLCRLDYREFCTMIHSRKSQK